MKKLFLGLLLTVFTLSIYSCRETTESTETNIEEIDTEMDEVGEDLEDAVDEVGDEIDNAADEMDEEVDVDVDVDEEI